MTDSSSQILGISGEDLEERLERITGGQQRVKDRFYDGIVRRRGSFERSSPHPSSNSARTTDEVRTTQCTFENKGGKLVPSKLTGPLNNPLADPVERNFENQPQARWPEEAAITIAPISLLSVVPDYEQKFAQPPSKLSAYVPRSKRKGRRVYYRGSRTQDFFSERTVRSYKNLEPWSPSSENLEDTTVLQFESRFESGNLQKAFQVSEYEYELKLSTDLYTTRHTQWFFFRVSNTRRGKTYAFNILNLLKSDSLYNHGMQPVVYSRKAAEEEGIGWIRAGLEVQYYSNTIPLETNDKRTYNTLRWKHIFRYDEDDVFFAHCYPMTYTDLQNYLTNLALDSEKTAIMRHRIMCKTLAGNVCDLLTITEYGCAPHEMAKRKGAIFTARVHPGETNGSWMMKGLIDFLVSDHPDAVILRKYFVIKIVPMLNPDGVIVGNYRCSLAGVDLNRTYKNPMRELCPTIYALKRMMYRFCKDRKVTIYCDLHGHSRKQNVFIYGCTNKTNPDKIFMERIFPMMMSMNSDKFSYKGSRFAVKRGKEATGRVSTWRELDMINSFTMEATFCGATSGKKANIQFNTDDFESLGRALCDSLLDYVDPDQAKAESMLTKFRLQYFQRRLKKAEEAGKDLNSDISDSDSESDSASVGSDSSSSGGETLAAEQKLMRKRPSMKPKRFIEKKEVIIVKPPVRAKKKKAKKARKKKNGSARVSPGDEGDVEDEGDQDSRATTEKKKKIRSKYDLMPNKGLPTYAQERVLERARHRQEQVRIETELAVAQMHARENAYAQREDYGLSLLDALGGAQINLQATQIVDSTDEPAPSDNSSVASPAVRRRSAGSARSVQSQRTVNSASSVRQGPPSATIKSRYRSARYEPTTSNSQRTTLVMEPMRPNVTAPTLDIGHTPQYATSDAMDTAPRRVVRRGGKSAASAPSNGLIQKTLKLIHKQSLEESSGTTRVLQQPRSAGARLAPMTKTNKVERFNQSKPIQRARSCICRSNSAPLSNNTCPVCSGVRPHQTRKSVAKTSMRDSSDFSQLGVGGLRPLDAVHSPNST